MRLFLITVIVLFACNCYSQPLKITHLTGDIYVYTTWREYRGTPFPSNSMYLVTAEGIVLIDVPWDTTQFQPLLDSLEKKHDKKPLICIATHSHEDRTAGLQFFKNKGIQTYTSLETDRILKVNGEKRAEFIFTKDTVFNIGGYRIETFYPGKGHAPDNIVLWFGKDKVLYGGCFIKSTEADNLGNLSDADIKKWPASLLRMQKKYPDPHFVIPGHQDWKGNPVQHTLKLLQEHNH